MQTLQSIIDNFFEFKPKMNKETNGKYAYLFFFNPLITTFPVPDLLQG